MTTDVNADADADTIMGATKEGAVEEDRLDMIEVTVLS